MSIYKMFEDFMFIGIPDIATLVSESWLNVTLVTKVA